MPRDEITWVKWYPADHINDVDLRGCSLRAQGLWARILARMFLSPKRGFLQDSRGRELTPETLASLEGQSLEEVRAALAELEGAGVFSRDESGIPYSRRLVRDEARRERGRFTGAKGGNPALKRSTSHDEQPSVTNPPEGHPLFEAFRALHATNKLNSLTLDGLALVANAHPKAELAKRFREVVTHAENVAGIVGDPVQWLKRRLSDMEPRFFDSNTGAALNQLTSLDIEKAEFYRDQEHAKKNAPCFESEIT